LQDIAKNEVMKGILKEVEGEVDSMIDVEIKNRRTMWLKGKRDHIKKPPRVKPIPEKFGLGEKPLAKIPTQDLFHEVKNIYIYTIL
jgi:hypothetical protein